MSAQNQPLANPEGRATAGAAGAGGGTLLVLLAQNLPDENPWKSWLLIIAPAASVGLSAFWIWLRSAIAAAFRERSLRAAVRRAKATLEDALADESTSADHKRELRSQLEELQLLLVQSRKQEVVAIVKR